MDHAAFFISQAARITETRDRSSAEKALVDVVRTLLSGPGVGLFELVQVDADVHCMMRAQALPGDGAIEALPFWYPASNCPLLSDAPYRHQSAHQLAPVRFMLQPSGAFGLVVSSATDTRQVFLLEVHGSAEWTPAHQQVMESCLKLFCNFVNLLNYGERDTLTGLLNRKSFDEAFFRMSQLDAEDVPSALNEDDRRMTAPSCWMAVVDIDHFKRVNDAFGHLIGDEVLLLVARILQATFRQEDRVYRFGGEEFVILLRAPSADWAAAALERLRKAVENHRFPQVERVTISVGFSMIRRHDTPSGAFDRADQAVYQAKSLGRNQICSFEMLGLSGRSTHSADQNTVELF